MNCFHHVVVILSVTSVSESYFIPGSVLFFDNAIQFCQEICNSGLASIHSSTQMEAAINAIYMRPKSIWGGIDREHAAYIGLSSPDLNTIPLTWSDSTAFDFGNVSGTWPWLGGHPQPKTPTCVLLDASINSWKSVQCDYAAERVLCNHCNGKINKYGLISVNQDRNTANTACDIMYGTTLASVHTERDNMEIKTLWSVNDKQNAWIGLQHDETDITKYIWSDATEFDYGTGPGNAGANELCVVIGTNQEWDDTSCSNVYGSICNLPSELDSTLNTWTAVAGEWSWNTNKELLSSTSQLSEITILDKQWYNGNELLLIEYRFLVDFSGLLSYSGIDIYNGASASYCEWYWIGIGREYSKYYVMMTRGTVTDPTGSGATWSQRLDFTFEEDKYYTMSAMIENGNTFTITINDQTTSFIDTEGYSTLDNGLSGYIALFSDKDVQTKAKYLYISGTPETVAKFNASADTNCISLSPTSPTNIPSNSPEDSLTDSTQSPSDIPSVSAIDTLTKDPTATGTSISPTPLPVNHPTQESVITSFTQSSITALSTTSRIETFQGDGDESETGNTEDTGNENESNALDEEGVLFIVIIGGGMISACMLCVIIMLLCWCYRKKQQSKNAKTYMGNKSTMNGAVKQNKSNKRISVSSSASDKNDDMDGVNDVDDDSDDDVLAGLDTYGQQLEENH